MNYIITLSRILEISFSKLLFHETLCVKMLIQVPQARNRSSVMELTIWDNLENSVLQFYHRNDLILIEGYLTGTSSYYHVHGEATKKFEIAQINAIKIHPIVSD